jgi:hypothetical protein
MRQMAEQVAFYFLFRVFDFTERKRDRFLADVQKNLAQARL